MASGAQILLAATVLEQARQELASRQADFNAQEAIVQSLILPESQARDAAQLAFALAQDQARAGTPGWQLAVEALNAAVQAESAAVSALLALTFDGS